MSGVFPSEITVRLVPHDEVLSLREEVKQLREKLDTLQRAYNETEYRFRCESVINNRLIDFCRESGLRIDPAILHWSNEHSPF